MSYVAKREFAARVFAETLDWMRNGDSVAVQIARILAQAQLDRLPTGGFTDTIDHSGGKFRPAECWDIDQCYALAVQLAPLVGVEVME